MLGYVCATSSARPSDFLEHLHLLPSFHPYPPLSSISYYHSTARKTMSVRVLPTSWLRHLPSLRPRPPALPLRTQLTPFTAASLLLRRPITTTLPRRQNAAQDPYTTQNSQDEVNVKQKVDDLAKIVKNIKVRLLPLSSSACLLALQG